MYRLPSLTQPGSLLVMMSACRVTTNVAFRSVYNVAARPFNLQPVPVTLKPVQNDPSATFLRCRGEPEGVRSTLL